MTEDATHHNCKFKLNGQFITVLKWVILLAAYIYIAVVLIRFDKYDELWAHFNHISWSQFLLLMLVLVLLPLNLFFEAYKWKLLVSKTEQISYPIALKSVLAGFSTGFFTPNRTGEFAGRVLFLNKANRVAGVFYAITNSLTQNLILAICGIPSAVIFFFFLNKDITFLPHNYLLIIISLAIVMLFLYFSIPYIAKMTFWKRFSTYTNEIKQFTFRKLVFILTISLARYIVFCLQFYALLLFFGIELAPWQALVAIPANYLFVTFTPSLAFSETAIRSSYAVIFIGAFSPQLAGIAFAGAALWLVNFGIPMLVGAHFVVRKR